MRITEVDRKITQGDIDQLERFADKLFAKVGIDVEFTRHFLDRVNDERNVRQITASELTRLFKQEYKQWGKKIAQLGPDAEAVMKDLATDVNMPFALVWDHKNQELDLIAKTIMRKKNFKTPNQEFKVEDVEYELSEKQIKRIDELDLFAPKISYVKLPNGDYVKVKYRNVDSITGHGRDNLASFVQVTPVDDKIIKTFDLDSRVDYLNTNDRGNKYKKSNVLSQPQDHQGGLPFNRPDIMVYKWDDPEFKDQVPDGVKAAIVDKLTNESFVMEAAPAALAIPVGVGAMELLALGLGFATIAALQQAYKQNPSSIPNFAHGAIDLYNRGEEIVSDMLGGNDAAEARAQAQAAYQTRLQQSVTSALSARSANPDIAAIQDYLDDIAKADSVSDSEAGALAAAPEIAQSVPQLTAPELSEPAQAAVAAIRPDRTFEPRVARNQTPAMPAAQTDAPPSVDTSAPAAPAPSVDTSAPAAMTAPSADTSPRVAAPSIDQPVSTSAPKAAELPAADADAAPDLKGMEPPLAHAPDVDLGLDLPKTLTPPADAIDDLPIGVVPGAVDAPIVGPLPASVAAALASVPTAAKVNVDTATPARSPRERDRGPKRRRGFDIGADDGEYDDPLQRWVKKWTPSTFTTIESVEKKSLISESGSAPGVGPIHKDEIAATLAPISKELGVDLMKQALGSVGKKQFSGDIDVAINLPPEQLPEFGAKLEASPLFSYVEKTSVFITKIKIQDYDPNRTFVDPRTGEDKGVPEGRTGYVQLDFMPGDPGWMKTYYHSPSETESKYKGVYRNIMIATIAAVVDRVDSDQKLDDGRSMESTRFMWSPAEGLIKVRRTPVPRKDGKGYTAKNKNEVIEGPWRQADEIAKKLHLNSAADLNSFESLLDAIKKNLTAEQIQQIIKGFVDNPVVQDVGVPSELTEK